MVVAFDAVELVRGVMSWPRIMSAAMVTKSIEPATSSTYSSEVCPLSSNKSFRIFFRPS